MKASWVVYIDESGDEGFMFDKGSPDWFVLSAVVTQKSTDLETVKLVDHVREMVLKRKDHEPLHFRKMKHEHRIPYLHQLASADLKALTICIHKPSIKNVEIFQQRYRMYFYASRLLLERVSWYCRDHNSTTGGDGSAEIIFSNRGGMKYEEFREYMDRLQHQTRYGDVQIDWNVIKRDQITAYSAKRMGLQLADAVASGFFFGIQRNQYGFAEDRYARMLQPITYKSSGRYAGYGLKFWPQECAETIKTQSHLTWLQEVYGFEI